MSVAVLTPSDYERAVDESSRPRLGAASREEKRRYVFGARPRVAQGARSGVSSQPSNDGGRWYLRVIDGGAQTSAEAAPIPPRAVASAVHPVASAVHPVGSAAHPVPGTNAASVQAGGSEGVAAQAHPVKAPARTASANSGEAVFTAPMRRLAIALAFAAAIAGGSAIGTLTQGDAHMAGGDYSVSVEAQGK